MTREEKLEAALKVAIRMRKGMIEIGEPVEQLLVPRKLVEAFDAKLKELAK